MILLLKYAAQNGAEKALVKLGMLLESMNLENTIFTSTDTPFLPSTAEGEGEMAKQYKDRLIIGYTPDGKPIPVWVTGKGKTTFYDNVVFTYAEHNMLERLGYKLVKLEEPAVHVKTEAPSIQDTPTFLQYTEEWLSLQRDSYRQNTYKAYETILNAHLYPYFGGMPLKEITHHTVQQYLNMKREMSKGSLSTHLARLKAIFASAVEEGLITVNPVKHRSIRNPGRVLPRREALTEEERLKIIEAMPDMDETDALYIAICMFAGPRKSETLGLQWKHIQDKIQIRQQCQVNNKSIILPPKSECGVRDIPIQDRLKPYLAKHGNDEEYLFGKGTKPPTKYMFEKMWQRIETHLQGIGISSHILRHTFITECAENDVPVNYTQEVAGHSAPGITLGIYTHVTPKIKQNALQKLNSL